MKVLIVDNYDSFTFNLYHYFQQLTGEVVVMRNDELSPDDAEAFTHIVISPGPGLPSEAGNSLAIIERYFANKPILGVCLGCQALAEITGGSLYNQNLVAHGIQREAIKSDRNSWLLKGLPEKFNIGLYHSWAIKEDSLGTEWLVSCRTTNKVVMAIEHKSLPVAGVQFHPESIMSEQGLQLLNNWLCYSQV